MVHNTYFKIIIISLIFVFSCSTKAKETQSWDESEEITDKEKFLVETFADGFDVPWGMSFLPNHDLLVSDRNGTLWKVSKNGSKKEKISGVPDVRYKGQGGLLDIQIHPNFNKNRYVYISFSDFLPYKNNKSFTSIIRAELKNNYLINTKIIYKADEKFYTSSKVHYGTRIIFDEKNCLYFSINIFQSKR